MWGLFAPTGWLGATAVVSLLQVALAARGSPATAAPARRLTVSVAVLATILSLGMDLFGRPPVEPVPWEIGPLVSISVFALGPVLLAAFVLPIDHAVRAFRARPSGRS